MPLFGNLASEVWQVGRWEEFRTASLGREQGRATPARAASPTASSTSTTQGSDYVDYIYSRGVAYIILYYILCTLSYYIYIYTMLYCGILCCQTPAVSRGAAVHAEGGPDPTEEGEPDDARCLGGSHLFGIFGMRREVHGGFRK